MIDLREKYESLVKLFLLKTFDIREGEIQRAFLMLMYIFLVISSLLIVKPVSISLFLANFGVEKLPYVFLLVSIIAAILSTFYAKALKKYTLKSIITATLVASIIALLIFWLLIFFNILEGWALYLFYIWVAIFGVLSASQFWILANIVFNVREAKRLFGFIGAGAIAGGIFGGYLTSILAPIINSQNILLISVFFLSLCIPLIKYIWNNNVKPTQTKTQNKKRTSRFEDHPFVLIKKSKHLTLLALIVGVSVIVAKLVEFQFSAVASREILDEDQLTAFFGFWFSNLNIISLLIQIFLTRRVVGVLGIGVSLLFLPFGVLIGALAILFFPHLWAAILLKTSDGSLKQSINKSGIELLALPIPVHIKNQAKTFIDVFVDSLATGLGGLLLLVFTVVIDLDIKYVSILIILLLIWWIYLVRQIRKEYIKSFMAKMDQDKEKRAPEIDLKNSSIIDSLIKVLGNGTEKQKIHVLKMIKEIQNDKLIPSLEKLLDHPSDKIKIEVVRNLYFYQNIDFSEKVVEYLNEDNEELLVTTFQYLFARLKENRIENIKEYLNSHDHKISAAALLAVAEETRDNIQVKRLLGLGKIVTEMQKRSSELPNDNSSIISSIKAIGLAKLSSQYDVIDKQLNSNSPDIQKAAIVAAGSSISAKFLPQLFELLGKDEFSRVAQKALANYSYAILPELKEKFENANTSVEIKRNIPEVFSLIGTQESVNILITSLESAYPSVRNESLKALNTLRKNFPHLKINQKFVVKIIVDEAKIYLDTLAMLYSQSGLENVNEKNEKAEVINARNGLIELLEGRLDGNLERIFRLLGLKYPPDEMLSVYNNINSKTPDLRINAIEYLDSVLEINIKKIIIPIIETAMLETITEDIIDHFNLRILSEYECLELLLNGKDNRLKLSTLYLISQLEDQRYVKLISPFIEHENLKIQSVAKQALSKIVSQMKS